MSKIELSPSAVESLNNSLERGALLKKEALTAELEVICAEHKVFFEAAEDMRAQTIRAANSARKLGIHLKTLCGHEQITFQFWHARCDGSLPFNFDSAKMFVAVADKMPEPAVELADAVAFVQTVLIAGELLELPERTGTHNAATTSLAEKFFCQITMMRQPWEKIIRSMPLEDWEPRQLETFLKETEWLAKEREKAMRLRKEKG